MAKHLFVSLLIFSLFSLSFSVPDNSLLNAIKILSTSGFASMALTLEFGSDNLIPRTPSLTIFSPTDTAYVRSGQPPLSLLHFHFSPVLLHLKTLKSLPSGTMIPTLFSNHSLIVTTSSEDEDQVSLNGVKVNALPIYSDANLIVFGIEDFFDPDSETIWRSPPSHGTPIHDPPSHDTPGRDHPTHDLECHGGSIGYSFDEATRVLRSRNYSVIASFLDLQLGLCKDTTEITVFAPGDQVIAAFTGNISSGEFSSIFRRHVVPCRILWRDLVNFKKGASLPTFLKGFVIDVTKSGDNLLFNGVPATDQDMYTDKRVVIHGITGVLEAQKRGEEVTRTPSTSGSKNRRIEFEVKQVFAVLVSYLFLFMFGSSECMSMP